MKTFILIFIVIIISYFSIKKLIKSISGKGGCSCGNSSFNEKCESCHCNVKKNK